MKRFGHVILIAAFSAIVVMGAIAGSPSSNDRAEAVGTRIMCPVCQGSAIANSPSDTAVSMMDKVEELVASGWSDEEILDFFRERYGDNIILDPPFSGKTLLLWLLPFGAFGVGVPMILGRRRPSVSHSEAP